jgi:3-isopropylmalate/(R)-2-methylmalate dehydratase small subunit
MEINNKGSRIWLLGDNIDTDLILPSQYVTLIDLKQKSRHTFESLIPGFADKVHDGDIIVGQRNFGCGSSREQAPQVIKELQIKAIIAQSFARIFYRNCINLGLPVIECPDYCKDAHEEDRIDVSFAKGTIHCYTAGKEYAFEPFPEFIRQIIDSGGLAQYIYQKTHS